MRRREQPSNACGTRRDYYKQYQKLRTATGSCSLDLKTLDHVDRAQQLQALDWERVGGAFQDGTKHQVLREDTRTTTSTSTNSPVVSTGTQELISGAGTYLLQLLLAHQISYEYRCHVPPPPFATRTSIPSVKYCTDVRASIRNMIPRPPPRLPPTSTRSPLPPTVELLLNRRRQASEPRMAAPILCAIKRGLGDLSLCGCGVPATHALLRYLYCTAGVQSSFPQELLGTGVGVHPSKQSARATSYPSCKTHRYPAVCFVCTAAVQVRVIHGHTSAPSTIKRYSPARSCSPSTIRAMRVMMEML